MSDPTLLLTRPQAQATRFADQCRDVIGQNAPIIISPVLRIDPREVTIDLAGVAGVALTSENGARVLAELTDVRGITAWCVGDRTARMAKSFGMVAISAGGAVSDLASFISKASPNGVVLHAHGARSAGDLVKELQNHGIQAKSLVIYDQTAQSLSTDALRALQTSPVILPLFSPFSASSVAQQLTKTARNLAIVALSGAVAQAWTGPKPDIFTVATHPDAPHMISKIATIWSDLSA